MNDTLLVSIFMALEGLHAYSAFLPSVFTIKTFVKTEDGRAMIREGEFMASSFLLALAVTTSYLTKSKWPAIMALGAGGLMVVVYEYALARAPVSTGNMDTDDKPNYGGDQDLGGPNHEFYSVRIER